MVQAMPLIQPINDVEWGTAGSLMLLTNCSSHIDLFISHIG